MISKKIVVFLILCSLVCLPHITNAEILKKDYTDLLKYNKVCHCTSNNTKKCSVMIVPSGVDYLSGECPADRSLIGVNDNLISKVKDGYGCGGINTTNWTGGALYFGDPISFGCSVPKIESKCLCKDGALDGVTNEMVYKCQMEFVSDDQIDDIYKTFVTIKGCPAEFRISLGSDYCCCKNGISGEYIRSCKKVSVGVNAPYLSCSEGIYNGLAVGEQSINPDFLSFQLDVDGGCAAWEKSKETTAAAPNKTFDASQQLAKEAASVLNPMKFKTGAAGINDLIGRAVKALTSFIGSLLLLFYVYAGILWMTAQGNTEKIGKAKQIIIWSTLGVVVVLASYAIVKLVFSYVG